VCFYFEGETVKKLLLLLSFFAAANANATLIDFTGANQSGKSFTIGDVTFTDSDGSGLQTGSWNESNYSQALAVFGDDASRLQLSFGATYNFLSFDFGNDDPRFGDPIGQMHLDLYLDGALTNAYAMTANWDDLMNQNLAGTGMFNYAEIYYDSNLIEVVDNIEYRLDNVSAVPEPSSIALLGLGLIGMSLARKTKGDTH
jgi:hypothetical protein